MAYALDTTKPDSHENTTVELKPVLKDIIRTKLCDKPVQFLVDRIHVVSFVVDGEEAQTYRMWLSDGHKIIQGTDPIFLLHQSLYLDTNIPSALIKRELHPFITEREIQEGSFVLVTRYHLSTGQKVEKPGNVWYE